MRINTSKVPTAHMCANPFLEREAPECIRVQCQCGTALMQAEACEVSSCLIGPELARGHQGWPSQKDSFSVTSIASCRPFLDIQKSMKSKSPH
jgi:hypothetical protein